MKIFSLFGVTIPVINKMTGKWTKYILYTAKFAHTQVRTAVLKLLCLVASKVFFFNIILRSVNFRTVEIYKTCILESRKYGICWLIGWSLGKPVLFWHSSHIYIFRSTYSIFLQKTWKVVFHPLGVFLVLQKDVKKQ